MCSADVFVSQLQWFPFVRHTHRPHDWDKHLHRFEKWPLAEKQLGSWWSSLNITLLLRFVFACTQPRSNFLAGRGPQTCLCPPKLGPTVSYLLLCTLASDQSRRHLQNELNQFFHVSQPTQDLRADTHRWHHPRIFLLLRFDNTLEEFLVLVRQSHQPHSTDYSLKVAHEVLYSESSQSILEGTCSTTKPKSSRFIQSLSQTAFQRSSPSLLWFSNCVWRNPVCCPNVFTRVWSHPLNIPPAHKSFHDCEWLILSWISSSYVLSTMHVLLDVHVTSSDQQSAVACSIAIITWRCSRSDINFLSVFPGTVSQGRDLCLECRSTATVHSHQ